LNRYSSLLIEDADRQNLDSSQNLADGQFNVATHRGTSAFRGAEGKYLPNDIDTGGHDDPKDQADHDREHGTAGAGESLLGGTPKVRGGSGSQSSNDIAHGPPPGSPSK
jgi:hypothetical protein